MRDGLCEETKYSLLPPIGALLSPEWVAPVEPCPISEMKCYVDTSVLRGPRHAGTEAALGQSPLAVFSFPPIFPESGETPSTHLGNCKTDYCLGIRWNKSQF